MDDYNHLFEKRMEGLLLGEGKEANKDHLHFPQTSSVWSFYFPTNYNGKKLSPTVYK